TFVLSYTLNPFIFLHFHASHSLLSMTKQGDEQLLYEQSSDDGAIQQKSNNQRSGEKSVFLIPTFLYLPLYRPEL
ncbi:hypothetical protein XENOCAPTIV_005655, partial [Xenoophorus captivus]